MTLYPNSAFFSGHLQISEISFFYLLGYGLPLPIDVSSVRTDFILFAMVSRHPEQCQPESRYKEAFFPDKYMNLLNECMFVVGWFSWISSILIKEFLDQKI